MGEVKFIDTGYLNKQKEGSQESRIVNSGTALSLFANNNTKVKRASQQDQSPTPGSLTYYNTNSGSTNPTQYDVTLKLKNNVADDQLLFKHLVGIDNSDTYFGADRTAGIKALYLTNTNSSYKSVIELLGSTDTDLHESSDGANDAPIPFGLPAILVLVDRVTVEEDKNSSRTQLTVTLECVQA